MKKLLLLLLAFFNSSILSIGILVQPDTRDFLHKDIKQIVEEDESIKKLPFLFERANNQFLFGCSLRPSIFYGKNLHLLNSCNKEDRIFYVNHFLDLFAEYHYGIASNGYSIFQFKVDIRNEGIWGDFNSILSTGQTRLKRLDIDGLTHSHFIPRFIFWVREMWLEFSLNDIFGWCPDNLQTFILGAFPYALGRGISLGSAFAVNPEPEGFFTKALINQFAFGAKFSGEIMKDELFYDLYWGLLNNKAGTFTETNEFIRTHEYGHRLFPKRGSGIVNYVIAARLNWNPVYQEDHKIHIEPYFLFNDNRELFIEFLGDGRAILFTPGISFEFEWGNFEGGFETAFNRGHAYVRGVDRNSIVEQNRNGVETVVNSNVVQDGASALVTPANQAVVNSSPQTVFANGNVIGTTSLGTLSNNATRFRDPFTVSFKGAMFVCDFGYYFKKPNFKVAAGFGYATGDNAPDLEIKPGQSFINFHGFISLQDEYTGGRLRSAFLLVNAGGIPRSFSDALDEEGNLDLLPVAVDFFTNILFTGANLTINIPCSRHNWVINPNVISFWQTHSGSITTPRGVVTPSKHLGLELNLITDATILPDIHFFSILALFLPGKHYRDITDVQLSFREQLEIGLESDEIDASLSEIIKSDKAWYIQCGLNCKF
jgi:hypothetical protein